MLSKCSSFEQDLSDYQSASLSSMANGESPEDQPPSQDDANNTSLNVAELNEPEPYTVNGKMIDQSEKDPSAVDDQDISDTDLPDGEENENEKGLFWEAPEAIKPASTPSGPTGLILPPQEAATRTNATPDPPTLHMPWITARLEGAAATTTELSSGSVRSVQHQNGKTPIHAVVRGISMQGTSVQKPAPQTQQIAPMMSAQFRALPKSEQELQLQEARNSRLEFPAEAKRVMTDFYDTLLTAKTEAFEEENGQSIRRTMLTSDGLPQRQLLKENTPVLRAVMQANRGKIRAGGVEYKLNGTKSVRKMGGKTKEKPTEDSKTLDIRKFSAAENGFTQKMWVWIGGDKPLHDPERPKARKAQKTNDQTPASSPVGSDSLLSAVGQAVPADIDPLAGPKQKRPGKPKVLAPIPTGRQDVPNPGMFSGFVRNGNYATTGQSGLLAGVDRYFPVNAPSGRPRAPLSLAVSYLGQEPATNSFMRNPVLDVTSSNLHTGSGSPFAGTPFAGGGAYLHGSISLEHMHTPSTPRPDAERLCDADQMTGRALVEASADGRSSVAVSTPHPVAGLTSVPSVPTADSSARRQRAIQHGQGSGELASVLRGENSGLTNLQGVQHTASNGLANAFVRQTPQAAANRFEALSQYTLSQIAASWRTSKEPFAQPSGINAQAPPVVPLNIENCNGRDMRRSSTTGKKRAVSDRSTHLAETPAMSGDEQTSKRRATGQEKRPLPTREQILKDLRSRGPWHDFQIDESKLPPEWRERRKASTPAMAHLHSVPASNAPVNSPLEDYARMHEEVSNISAIPEQPCGHHNAGHAAHIFQHGSLSPLCTDCTKEQVLLFAEGKMLRCICHPKFEEVVKSRRCVMCFLAPAYDKVEMAKQQRKNVDASGQVVMHCACGKAPDAVDNVRRCDHCGGVAFDPFIGPAGAVSETIAGKAAGDA